MFDHPWDERKASASELLVSHPCLPTCNAMRGSDRRPKQRGGYTGRQLPSRPLLRRLAGGTAAGGRCARAFPRGRRRAARAQFCWHTARVVTQPRRTGGAAREARAISYFQGWIRPFQGHTFENPQPPSLLVTISISRLSNTKCCDGACPISFSFLFWALWDRTTNKSLFLSLPVTHRLDRPRPPSLLSASTNPLTYPTARCML